MGVVKILLFTTAKRRTDILKTQPPAKNANMTFCVEI